MYTIIKDKSTDDIEVAKWEEHNALRKVTILNNMQDDLIPLYKGHDIAKEIMDLLENKYRPNFETYIQLQLAKFNGLRISKNDSVVDYIMKLEILKNDLSNAYSILKKMQVLVLFNSLPRT